MHPLDLRILRTSTNGSEIDKVIEKSLSEGDFDENIINIVRARSNEDGYIPSNRLAAKIVIKTKDVYFLDMWFSPLKFAPNYLLVEFYREKIQDSRIETLLVEYLYKYSLTPSDTNKFNIVRAIHEVGSVGTLDTLDTIEQELRDRAIVAKNFGKNLPVPDVFEGKLHAQFYDLVLAAILQVKARNSQPVEDIFKNDMDKFPSLYMPDHINKFLDEAELNLKRGDYVSAANKLRFFLEAVSKFLNDLIDPGTQKDWNKFIQHLKAMEKQNNLNFIWQGKTARFPPMLEAHLRAASHIANAGSHFLGSDYQIRGEDILPYLEIGRLIRADVIEWLKTLK